MIQSILIYKYNFIHLFQKNIFEIVDIKKWINNINNVIIIMKVYIDEVGFPTLLLILIYFRGRKQNEKKGNIY